MDAVKFLEILNRMCATERCGYCPLGDADCCVSNTMDVDPKETVEIVEKWDKEHPKMTNGRKVMKVLEEMGNPCEEIEHLSNEHIVNVLFGKDWWDAPYEGE